MIMCGCNVHSGEEPVFYLLSAKLSSTIVLPSCCSILQWIRSLESFHNYTKCIYSCNTTFERYSWSPRGLIWCKISLICVSAYADICIRIYGYTVSAVYPHQRIHCIHSLRKVCSAVLLCSPVREARLLSISVWSLRFHKRKIVEEHDSLWGR